MTGLDAIRADWEHSQFVRITPLLLHECNHDAVVAIVMSHILYRTYNGERWIPMLAEEVCQATGLTMFQTRRGLKVVRENGWVVSRRVDKWNPALEWTVAGGAVLDSEPVVALDSEPVLVLDQQHSGDAQAATPTYRREQGKQEELLEAFALQPAVLVGELIDPKAPVRAGDGDLFEVFWSHAVKKKNPRAARKALAGACKVASPEVILAAWIEHNNCWRTWAKGEPRRYIPYPTTWLNGGDWDGELPELNKGQDSHAHVAQVLNAATAGMTEEEERRALFPEMYVTHNKPDNGSQTVAIAAITRSGDRTSHQEE